VTNDSPDVESEYVTLADLYRSIGLLLEHENFSFHKLRSDSNADSEKIRYDSLHGTVNYMLELTERQVFSKELSPGDEDQIADLIHEF